MKTIKNYYIKYKKVFVRLGKVPMLGILFFGGDILIILLLLMLIRRI